MSKKKKYKHRDEYPRDLPLRERVQNSQRVLAAMPLEVGAASMCGRMRCGRLMIAMMMPLTAMAPPVTKLEEPMRGS